MEDNFSKRRYYLNRKDKNNSYNKTKTNEKIDALNLKLEFNNNKEKEKNSKRNSNQFDRNKKFVKEQSNKHKDIKNLILYSNNNESNNSLKDTNKKINYFRFSMQNKILLSPNNYVNAINKINNNNLGSAQNNNKFNLKYYNKSFEINIKPKGKNGFEEINTKNENKMNNNISNVKIKNHPNEEKKKKEGVNSERKSRFFSSYYRFRTKKQEIIKIQKVWRGYYFRLKKVESIKRCHFLNALIKIIIKNLKYKIKIIYNEFLKILKTFIKRKDEIGKIENINSKGYYNGYTKQQLTSNNISSIRNINNGYNNSPRNKTGNQNIKVYSTKSEINSEFNIKNNYNHKNNEKNINDIDDIFNSPFKIIYVSKKIHNKNRYYYMKRITNIKKLKLEKFIKFIKKKYLNIYFTIFKNTNKFNSNYYKIKNLFFAIDLVFKKNLRNYLQIYREKILDIKAKEEIMKKKTLSILNENKNNDFKLKRKRRFLNENKEEKKSSMKLKRNIDKNIKVKFLSDNIVNDIILENINESENEEDNQKNNSKLINKKEYFILLNKIVSKKIKNNLIILNKYFNRWKKFSNLFNDNRAKIKLRNMHSPDIEIRGKKSKKKYIKIKLSKALTTKTSLSSIKSEGRSNSSSTFYTKKMKVRSLVINPSNYSIINYKTENNYKINTMLSNLLNKIDNKIDIIKCFKIWKKSKRNRRSFSQK